MNHKRHSVISKDTLGLLFATIPSFRSKDPRTPNGAAIVNQEGRILSVGYNGFPDGCSDDVFPWIGEAEHSWETKYDYVIHAEQNAIDNYSGERKNLRGTTMWIFSDRGYFPCKRCTQEIVQAKIAEVVLAFVGKGGSQAFNYETSVASIRMLDAAGVKLRILGDEMPIMIQSVIYRLQRIIDTLPQQCLSFKEQTSFLNRCRRQSQLLRTGGEQLEFAFDKTNQQMVLPLT